MFAAHRSVRRMAGTTFVVLALAAASAGCGGDKQPGKILFQSDLPSGNAACVPAKAVTTVAASADVYATYNFKSKPGATVSVEITKDGTSLLKVDLPSSTTVGLDCLSDTTNLSKTVTGWGAGTIRITATEKGTEIASGELTVTP